MKIGVGKGRGRGRGTGALLLRTYSTAYGKGCNIIVLDLCIEGMKESKPCASVSLWPPIQAIRGRCRFVSMNASHPDQAQGRHMGKAVSDP